MIRSWSLGPRPHYIRRRGNDRTTKNRTQEHRSQQRHPKNRLKTEPNPTEQSPKGQKPDRIRSESSRGQQTGVDISENNMRGPTRIEPSHNHDPPASKKTEQPDRTGQIRTHRDQIQVNRTSPTCQKRITPKRPQHNWQNRTDPAKTMEQITPESTRTERSLAEPNRLTRTKRNRTERKRTDLIERNRTRPNHSQSKHPGNTCMGLNKHGEHPIDTDTAANTDNLAR